MALTMEIQWLEKQLFNWEKCV